MSPEDVRVTIQNVAKLYKEYGECHQLNPSVRYKEDAKEAQLSTALTRVVDMQSGDTINMIRGALAAQLYKPPGQGKTITEAAMTNSDREALITQHRHEGYVPHPFGGYI